jgi:hypothetical protein
VSDEPVYDLLLRIHIQAEVAPDMAIPNLKRLIKHMGRAFNFRLLDCRQVAWPKQGKPALPQEDAPLGLN